MKKYPKYIILPVVFALYFAAMAVYSFKQNGNRMPDDFVTILAIEVVILIALFLSLRYLHNKRKQ